MGMSEAVRVCSFYSKMTSASRSQSITSEKLSDNESTSQVSGNIKPLHIFYIWYVELCRRQNTNPIYTLRSPTPKNDQILEFLADRIKIEDWQPIINALRLDTSLHVISIHSRLVSQKVFDDADTEEKVKRIKKWFGAICTKYVLKNLLKAIGNCLKMSLVLTCLEFDGLKITKEYLPTILKPLLSNTSLKYLSFKACPIEDDGCLQVCNSLHSLPNVEVINLSSCGLGTKSAEYLSKLIKYQQLNRYCESWHSSLRYKEPEINNMTGLKRITINNNPKIGNEGLELILNELMDDLWIKAIDMQRCNITDLIAAKLEDVIDYNRSLEVADFRNNNLSNATMDRILELLKAKQPDDADIEYQWCLTSTSIGTPNLGTYTTIANSKLTTKFSKNMTNRVTFKCKSKTQILIKSPIEQKNRKEKLSDYEQPSVASMLKSKEQLMHLFERVKQETALRRKAEQRCEELQKQLEELLNQQRKEIILEEFNNIKTYIKKFKEYIKKYKEHESYPVILLDLKKALDDVKNLAKPYEPSESITSSTSNMSSAMISSPIAYNTPVRNETENEGLQMKNLIEKLLVERKTRTVNSCHKMDIDLSSVNSKQEFDLELVEMSNSSRSTDSSESLESYKRLLEQLSKDVEIENCSAV